jgi:uncharacterized protein (DUF433 family)
MGREDGRRPRNPAESERRKQANGMTETAIQTRLHLDDEGHVWIEGANTTVIQIAMDKYAHGWSAEEIQAQHPHLSLAQIHAALSYYYDHKTEIDRQIERVIQEDDVLRAQAGPSKAENRLRQHGLLP